MHDQYQLLCFMCCFMVKTMPLLVLFNLQRIDWQQFHQNNTYTHFSNLVSHTYRPPVDN